MKSNIMRIVIATVVGLAALGLASCSALNYAATGNREYDPSVDGMDYHDYDDDYYYDYMGY